MNMPNESNASTVILFPRGSPAPRRKKRSGMRSMIRKSRAEEWDWDRPDGTDSTSSFALDFPSRKTLVRFSAEETFHQLPAVSLTRTEKANVWYKKADLERFKNHHKDIAKAAQAAKIFGTQLKQMDEVRGLERQLSEQASQTSQQLIELALKAVLREQSRQQAAGIYDECRIRKEYLLQTRKSKAEAYALGVSDANLGDNSNAVESDKSPQRPGRKLSIRAHDKSPLKPNRKFSFRLPVPRKESNKRVLLTTSAIPETHTD